METIGHHTFECFIGSSTKRIVREERDIVPYTNLYQMVSCILIVDIVTRRGEHGRDGASGKVSVLHDAIPYRLVPVCKFDNEQLGCATFQPPFLFTICLGRMAVAESMYSTVDQV